MLDVTPFLNTPVWRWSNTQAFGDNLVDKDPDGDGTKFHYNLRFAGQYFDNETRLHYNYFRDYDPETGRYISSDPIGLAGGLNTYGYALQNPLTYIDPTGESPLIFAEIIAKVGVIICRPALSAISKLISKLTKQTGKKKIGEVLSKTERSTMNEIFKGNKNLSDLSRNAREKAAQVFDRTAAKPGQHQAGIAFNKARSDFLRGNGPNPGSNARDFAVRKGIPLPGKGGQ